jgi:hypothetical protein
VSDKCLDLALSRFCDFFSSERHVEFYVIAYSTGRGNDVLTIAASTDLTYYHMAELRLRGVRYFRGPLEWNADPLEGRVVTLASDKEWAGVTSSSRASDFQVLLSFRNQDEETIVVGCSEVDVDFSTVYYYERKPLQEGERIASWVSDQAM